MFGPGPHLGSQRGLLAETISLREHQYPYPRSLEAHGVDGHPMRSTSYQPILDSFFLLQSEWHEASCITACYIMLQHQCKEKTLRFNALDASKLLDLSDNVATYLWLLTVWTRTACVCSQASSSTFVFSIEAPRGMVLCPMVSMFFLLRKHLQSRVSSGSWSLSI